MSSCVVGAFVWRRDRTVSRKRITPPEEETLTRRRCLTLPAERAPACFTSHSPSLSLSAPLYIETPRETSARLQGRPCSLLAAFRCTRSSVAKPRQSATCFGFQHKLSVSEVALQDMTYHTFDRRGHHQPNAHEGRTPL